MPLLECNGAPGEDPLSSDRSKGIGSEECTNGSMFVRNITREKQSRRIPGSCCMWITPVTEVGKHAGLAHRAGERCTYIKRFLVR